MKETIVLAWSQELTEYQRAIRKFVKTEVAPSREQLEFGELSPYDTMRRYYEAFGIGDSALERFEATVAGTTGSLPTRSAAETLIPMVEFSRYSPGIMTALGASISLTAGSILRSGTEVQKRRWATDLLSLKTIGAWAITEPDSGSDALGGMRSMAIADGDGWVLNGSKTFITNAPDADTIVFICKLDDGGPIRDRQIMTFVLDKGMPGLVQSRPMSKMGLHSSPTGEISVIDLHVGPDRRLTSLSRKGPEGGGAKAAFATERASVVAMALGMIEQCLDLSLGYAMSRVQFGQRIGDFQLIQLKLANMEVARLNVANLLFRYVELVDGGTRPTLAEASAMKLYAAQSTMAVALEAVQIFGGSGYMAENQVEQLCRDAKILQIYGGTDEIQVTQVAKDLLKPRNPAYT
jgi:alkylation response protein AidB-like acyl-CoA dehydrogenase